MKNRSPDWSGTRSEPGVVNTRSDTSPGGTAFWIGLSAKEPSTRSDRPVELVLPTSTHQFIPEIGASTAITPHRIEADWPSGASRTARVTLR